MDELLEQARLTNQLLRLAFGHEIETRLAGIASTSNVARVLNALRDQDLVAIDALQRASGVPRSSLYTVIATLERQGVIEKPRRGFVSISAAAAPYLPEARRGETQPD
jgi:predicted transcriptional regulator of viral defense system